MGAFALLHLGDLTYRWASYNLSAPSSEMSLSLKCWGCSTAVEAGLGHLTVTDGVRFDRLEISAMVSTCCKKKLTDEDESWASQAGPQSLC